MNPLKKINTRTSIIALALVLIFIVIIVSLGLGYNVHCELGGSSGFHLNLSQPASAPITDSNFDLETTSVVSDSQLESFPLLE